MFYDASTTDLPLRPRPTSRRYASRPEFTMPVPEPVAPAVPAPVPTPVTVTVEKSQWVPDVWVLTLGIVLFILCVYMVSIYLL